jgi:hypothetical protein
MLFRTLSEMKKYFGTRGVDFSEYSYVTFARDSTPAEDYVDYDPETKLSTFRDQVLAGTVVISEE